ncbi:hypothetical protein [Streptomyces sp. ME19-01-6]|uniref:hypothetical protein n=1 Tax=Streptomyces sp. ME19-01-6 TaxID=3028686 RepID=UPI0029A7B62B|nr:hypothetical protein [Streptomyces sp. ME19-01-6]MDX3232489.1 hypothetical protein [Streptomyces sp. ME19-01-6]
MYQANNGPVLTEEDRRTAYAARDKATRAHDRAVKRVKAVEDAVKRADECARSARESAELAHGVADVAETVHAAELSRLEAAMWGRTPGTAEYRRAFGVWVAAGREDLPEVEAADAAEVAADTAESEAESARETLAEARRVCDDLMHTFSEAFERAWGLLPLPEDCEYAARECVEFAKELGECVKEAEASAREAAWADSDAEDEWADAEDAHDYRCGVISDALFEAAEDLTGLDRTAVRLTAVQVQRGDLAAAVDVADVAPVAVIGEGDDVAAPQGAEVPAGHAAAEGAAECATADGVPVEPGYSLDVPAGERVWSRPGWDGSYEGRAAVLRGHVTEADARAAVERFPECVRMVGGPLVGCVSVAGVRVDLIETGESAYGQSGDNGAEWIRTGDPYAVTLPDGARVSGLWGEIATALSEWAIENRPEAVCTHAEAHADGHATKTQIAADIAAEREAERAKAEAAHEQARAAGCRLAAVWSVWSPVVHLLSDGDEDRVYDVHEEGRAAVRAAERAYAAGGVWGVRSAAERAERAAEWLYESARRSGLDVPEVDSDTPEAAPADAAERAEVAAAAPTPTGVSDPGSVDAWESDGGAVPGVATPRPVPLPRERDAERSEADMTAAVLEGMPANARKVYATAAERGWDVSARREWTGRVWVRVVVVSAGVLARAGLNEREHRAAWKEDGGGYMGSQSSAGYRDILGDVTTLRIANREHERTGRTVWGRDAAEWVRQMTDAAAKVSDMLAECRDAFNALDSSTPVGRRAVDIAAAAYSEAKTAESMAREAVDAAAAWMVETNAEDARGCAPWRPAVVLAGTQVEELRKHITGAMARAEREALGAPVVEAGQAELEAEETAWRKRCAAEEIEPTAAGYARVRQMFEDSTRDWVAWFAEHGDINASMVAQADTWSESRDNERQTSHPSRYTCASLAAGDRVAASALAYTLAVADHVTDEDLAHGRDVHERGAARVIERFRKDAEAVRRQPTGYNTLNERKHLTEWTQYPHAAHSNPATYAEHAPAQWATYLEARETYEGVQILQRSLKWEPRYAEERSSARAEAITAGTNGQAEARTAREASGQDAQAWAQALERLTAARARVAMAVAGARADVERAQECTGRVTDADGSRAEDVWSAARFCEEASDEVNCADREAAHYATGAETYREAGRLADYMAECERMERAAGEAESAATEVRHLFECAAEDADKAEAARAPGPVEPTVGTSADSLRAAEPGPVAVAFPAPPIPQPAPALESIGGGEPVGDPFDLLTGALAGLSARWDGVTGS